MICGAKWKTCNCPWFNYDQVETDRLIHFNVVEQHRVPVEEPAPEPRGYQEELERRQRQVDEDEHLARRMQFLGMDANEDGYRAAAAAAAAGGIYSVGNAHAHHMNQHYVPFEEDRARHPHATGVATAYRGMPHHARRDGRPEWGDAPAHHHAPGQEAATTPTPMPTRREPYRELHPQASPAAAAPPPYATANRQAPRGDLTDYAAPDHARPVPADRVRRASTRTERSAHTSRRHSSHSNYSILAGLTRSHGQGGRVGAWLQHVEEGLPPGELRNSDIYVAV